ncbi:uncharacterized protein HaLaN_28488, partial [Haematococcus lacustris]
MRARDVHPARYEKRYFSCDVSPLGYWSAPYSSVEAGAFMTFAAFQHVDARKQQAVSVAGAHSGSRRPLAHSAEWRDTPSSASTSHSSHSLRLACVGCISALLAACRPPREKGLPLQPCRPALKKGGHPGGDYFDGWHRGGRPAHGVYEGSYWELLGNCDALVDMLRKMSRAPPLEELPQLQLPDTAELPKWEDFKPALQPLPSEPTLPTLRLPVFRVPILDTEVPFLEPDYLELPDVPDMAREERLPIFFPPELMVQEPFDEPEFIAPEPPTITAAPQAPVFGKPQYGHDWTGSRPFTVELQPYVRPKQLE